MQGFRTTRWSLIAAARGAANPASRQALADLCELYWYPVYAFTRRQLGDPDRAQDATQSFFTRLLETNDMSSADPNRGRFRSFLLAACRNFLSNQHDYEIALKRGGGKKLLSLDFQNAEQRYSAEPADSRTPEQLFERRWALTMLDRALATLQAEFIADGKQALFDRLKGALTGDAPPYAQLASELDMSEGSVKVAVYRLKSRYRETLREQIGETVATPAEVDDEIRDLFAALG